MRTQPLTQLALLAALAGCTGERAKEATSAVIGKAVELSKGTASGVAEGMEEGRKGAPSADGAMVVTQWADLDQHGTITVLGKRAGEAGAQTTTVDLALENIGDTPLRFSGVTVLGFDADGFTLPTNAALDQTIPAKAKVKVTVTVSAEPAKVAKLRIWTQDLPVP